MLPKPKFNFFLSMTFTLHVLQQFGSHDKDALRVLLKPEALSLHKSNNVFAVDEIDIKRDVMKPMGLSCCTQAYNTHSVALIIAIDDHVSIEIM
jgi:hypothetical protein